VNEKVETERRKKQIGQDKGSSKESVVTDASGGHANEAQKAGPR